MDSGTAQESNKKVLAETDLTDIQKDVLLKTAAAFSRTELKELEKLLQDTKANSFIYKGDLAYHR